MKVLTIGEVARAAAVGVETVRFYERKGLISEPPRGATGWRSSLAILPGIAAALLPKVACPACWPAYAGLLSALGLSFLMRSAWLFPLTATFLAIAVGSLAFRAGNRRGYSPFALGLVASLIVLLGKFALESDAAMYAGLGLLVVASLWNSWPRRHAQVCVACSRPE